MVFSLASVDRLRCAFYHVDWTISSIISLRKWKCREISPVTKSDMGVYDSKTEKCFCLYVLIERKRLSMIKNKNIIL